LKVGVNKEMNNIFDFGRIRWMRNIWVFKDGNKKPVLTLGSGEPIISKDGLKVLIKGTSTVCRIKDFSGIYPESSKPNTFNIPKKVCQACEHFDNGYCKPKIELNRTEFNENLAKVSEKFAKNMKETFR
jgi:hypothetical protein